jgi:hypothetical protein
LRWCPQPAALPSGSSVRLFQCPRQEWNRAPTDTEAQLWWRWSFDLRRVACKAPPHSEDVRCPAPGRGIEPGHRPAQPVGRAVPKTAVLSGTLAGLLDRVSRPGLEPGHHAQHGRGASEAPMRSDTPSGHGSRSRRLDLHRHRAVYRTAAFLFGHVGTSSSAGSRTRLCALKGRDPQSDRRTSRMSAHAERQVGREVLEPRAPPRKGGHLVFSQALHRLSYQPNKKTRCRL